MKKIRWSRVIIVLALLSYAWIIPYEIRVGRLDGVAWIPVLIIYVIIQVPRLLNIWTIDIDSMDLYDIPDGKWR